MEISIGDRFWVRSYARSFVWHEVVGETSRSWIVARVSSDDQIKVPKSKPFETLLTDRQVAEILGYVEPIE